MASSCEIDPVILGKTKSEKFTDRRMDDEQQSILKVGLLHVSSSELNVQTAWNRQLNREARKTSQNYLLQGPEEKKVLLEGVGEFQNPFVNTCNLDIA